MKTSMARVFRDERFPIKNGLHAKSLVIDNKSVQRLEAELEARHESLRQKALIVSALSVIFNSILAVTAFTITLVRNSSSTSAFAADVALDAISSAIVYWRYYGYHHGSDAMAREQVSCIYLGILFVVSGSAVIGKASADLITQSLPSSIDFMLYLASSSLVICFGLALAKLWLWRRLRSDSMLLDAVNTFISVVFCGLIIGCAFLIDYDMRLWYLDPLISILLALFMALYGIKCIYGNFSAKVDRDGYVSVP